MTANTLLASRGRAGEMDEVRPTPCSPAKRAYGDLCSGDRFAFGNLSYTKTDVEGLAVRPLSGVTHWFAPDCPVRPEKDDG